MKAGGPALDPSTLSVADAKQLADIQAAGVTQETFNKAIAGGANIDTIAKAAPDLVKAQQLAAVQAPVSTFGERFLTLILI